jgi:hypothetical protein
MRGKRHMNLHRKLCVSTLWSLTKNIAPNLQKSFYLQRIWKYRKVVCVCAAPRFNSSGLKKVCAYWTVQKVGGENGSIEPSQMGHHSGWGPNIVLGLLFGPPPKQSGMTLFGSRTKWRELALFGMRSKYLFLFFY